MALNINEISEIIKKQIKDYNKKYEVKENGTVVSVGDQIVLIDGLDEVMMSELVVFDNEIYGLVMNLEEGAVGVVLMGEENSIKEGDTVYRTKRIIETAVGDNLLGRVVNSLGQSLDGKGAIKVLKTRPVERIAPGVMTRKSVSVPLETGIMAIDAIIPIGRGQRELIIGDRQTGKTAIAIDAIINQKGKDVYCVYVAIGQKASTVAQIVEKLKSADALSYTTIVSATASQSAPLQYLAPYTGIAIAEEWMEQGKDVLIIYDDLSKHAVAYRTMALLLRRPPGREAYPGDVFYLHSRLLERACRLDEPYGGGSITALPIIETQAGDISAYIPTNVISITDGQIFLNTDQFNADKRPAVDVGLSVSRVGSSAQRKYTKQVVSNLKLELAQYRELQSFSQFSSDLDEITKATLEHGERVVEVLRQKQFAPLHQADQAMILLAVQEKYTRWLPLNAIQDFKDNLVKYFAKNAQAKKIRAELIKEGQFNKTNIVNAKQCIAQVTKDELAKMVHYNFKDYGSEAEWKKFQTAAVQKNSK